MDIAMLLGIGALMTMVIYLIQACNEVKRLQESSSASNTLRKDVDQRIDYLESELSEAYDKIIEITKDVVEFERARLKKSEKEQDEDEQ